jgi:hypothetical protein
MSRAIIILTYAFLIASQFHASAHTTVELEQRLPHLSGEAKVDALNELASKLYSDSTTKTSTMPDKPSNLPNNLNTQREKRLRSIILGLIILNSKTSLWPWSIIIRH